MEKLVVVVGDKTSHGGTVVTGDDSFTICDRPAAGVGHLVDCPLHGQTEIIEGYDTVVLQPSRSLAYDGCKTSCGAVLIAGLQKKCVIDFPDEASGDESKMQEIHEGNDDEFKLFVATVWGEVASQSEVAWQAVGSVIMNRVGHHYWLRKGNTVRQMILHTGFDAAKHKIPEFTKAHAYLFNEHINIPFNEFEIKKLIKMQNSLRPIYYGKKVTTDANHYYSPKEQLRQHLKELAAGVSESKCKYKLIPEFTTEKGVSESPVAGLSAHDDLKFYHRI